MVHRITNEMNNKPDSKVTGVSAKKGLTERLGLGRKRPSLPTGRRSAAYSAQYKDATFSVMVRDLEGSIHFWNRAAERNYGWSRKDALGNVSHTLLDTVFPCPLDRINQELLATGKWEGELIHSLSDGMRIKVRSHWELQSADENQDQSVVEINNPIGAVDPKTAFLELPPAKGLGQFLLRNAKWWLCSLAVSLGALAVLCGLGDETVLIPLLE